MPAIRPFFTYPITYIACKFINEALSTLITRSNAKFLCILVPIPDQKFRVREDGLEGAVVDIGMVLVGQHVLFIFMSRTVNKPHPIRMGGVLSINEIWLYTILTNLNNTKLIYRTKL